MSELRVEVVEILSVENHPNADRLDIVQIAGWQCVAQKGRLHKGQTVVYLPIDSILPEKLETHLFPPDSKVKLNKHRIKTIRLRGAISQGMVITQQELLYSGFIDKFYEVGTDLAQILEITKYEPPESKTPQFNTTKVTKKKKNPNFKEYTDLQNFKWYPNLFTEVDDVVIMEKIHGSNFRGGYAPFYANTWWKKIKSWFGLNPEYEFVYGSHRVQLQDKLRYTGFYDNNVYLEAVEKYKLRDKIPFGYIVYGEIYGDKIQKDYAYGCGEGERKLVIFDVMKDGKYLDAHEVNLFCAISGLQTAPLEYQGYWPGQDIVKKMWVDSPSKLCTSQKVREGCVIKSAKEEQTYMGRKILKWKSDTFLLKAEDDTH